MNVGGLGLAPLEMQWDKLSTCPQAAGVTERTGHPVPKGGTGPAWPGLPGDPGGRECRGRLCQCCRYIRVLPPWLTVLAGPQLPREAFVSESVSGTRRKPSAVVQGSVF